MPDPFRRGRAALLAGLLALDGCARHATTAAVPVVPPAGVRCGTIAAIRPTGFAPPIASAGGVSLSILRAIGPVADPAAAQGGATEVIVRTDAGETISVVQGDASGLRPGERVVVTSGAPSRVAPLVAAAGG
jgi:hypothetical protein